MNMQTNNSLRTRCDVMNKYIYTVAQAQVFSFFCKHGHAAIHTTLLAIHDYAQLCNKSEVASRE